MTRVGSDDATGGIDEMAAHSGVLVVMGDALGDQPDDFGADAALYIYMGSHDAPAAANADFVLPLTTHAEQEGSFTNCDGRVQRFWPALPAPGMSRPAWLVLGALAGALARIAQAVPAFSGISYDDIGTRGTVVNESVSLTGD
jgi:NADH-quinone oxidoreductase subunit G